MSHRTFLIALACLILGGAGFVTWVTFSSKESTTQAQMETSRTTRKPTTKKSLAQNSNLPNRYEKLTENSVRWQVRVDQLRRMDASTLNQKEIDYLYSQLRFQPSGQKEAWWVVMNEVMEQIVKQEIASERITGEFTSIIADKQLDTVVCDYAVQHLSIYLKDHTNDSKDLEKALTSIVGAIKDPANQHNSIAGTSFMAMIEASKNPNHQQKVSEAFGQLESYLMPLISGESSASLATRTSAINAVGLIHAEQYLPVLRELVTTEETNDSVKLCSIASLGDFYAPSGPPSPSLASQPQVSSSTDPSTQSVNGTLNTKNSGESAIDRQILESIATSDTKFKHAATAALNKFQD